MALRHDCGTNFESDSICTILSRGKCHLQYSSDLVRYIIIEQAYAAQCNKEFIAIYTYNIMRVATQQSPSFNCVQVCHQHG